MNFLTKIANELGNDRGTKSFEAHGYTDIYYSLFYLWQNNPIKMLEIGVYDPRFPGTSIKMWKSFFSDLKFVGMDINPEAIGLEEDNVSIFIGDQGKGLDLTELIKKHGSLYDIIIDDGSHKMSDILTSFIMLYPTLRKGGYYIIEDLHCQHAKVRETYDAIGEHLYHQGDDSKVRMETEKLMIIKKAP